MTGRIQALDSLTIDKIAAGEVIDFPASCVKELIDNSLDAGASHIVIEADAGGRERIVVTDDGCGMCREDVGSCIKRHTTSKLRSIDDLASLSSRGFRGEALASMVAVSKVTIASAEHSGQQAVLSGTVLVASGGEVESLHETAAIPGTSISVESLFYNVPARRKFLKSPAKDAQDIVKVVTMLAFSAPHVSYKLILDGKLAFSVEGLSDSTDYAQRAVQLFSDQFQKGATRIDYSDQHFVIKGMLASLQNTRSNRSLQYVLINGRPVVSPVVSYTVKAACGTAIEQNRHPIFALSIEMDQSMLDINAHPQKKEVRFADEEAVRSAIYQAILQALYSVKDLYAVSKTCREQEQPFQMPRPTAFVDDNDKRLAGSCVEAPGPLIIETEPVCLAVIGDVALVQTDERSFSQEEMIIALDLRATMRSLLYMQACQKDSSTSSQTLLIPVALQLSFEEQSLLKQAVPKLQDLGFSLRPFGQNSYLVETIPAHLTGIDIEAFLLNALHVGVLTAHDMHAEERLKTLIHLQAAAMKELRPPISKDFALGVFKSWAAGGMARTAPDGSFCYASISLKSLKSSIAKGNLFVCQN
jgi:DNA mismatch repair protein MutL